MNLNGIHNGILYYDGLELKEGKKYKWSGRSDNLYTACIWNCKMKVILIKKKILHIKSSDDGKVSEWTLEDLINSGVKISKKTLFN